MARETVSAGDRLVVADSPAIANLNAFTWAMWLYPESSGIGTTVGHILSKVLNATTVYKRLRITSETRLVGTVLRGAQTSSAQSNSGALVFGEWMHVAMTYSEADGVRMYKNGTELSYFSRTVASGATSPDAGTSLYMLNMDDGSRTFDGRLAEVGVWSRILTGAEIASLSAGRHSPVMIGAGLVAAWRLLGSDSPEPDAVNENDAAVIGTRVADHPPGIVAGGARPERSWLAGMWRGELRRMG